MAVWINLTGESAQMLVCNLVSKLLEAEKGAQNAETEYANGFWIGRQEMCKDIAEEFGVLSRVSEGMKREKRGEGLPY